jgi:hypothetical protein
MDNIATNILLILISMFLIWYSLFMFIKLIIFVKKGFIRLFENIDLIVNRINNFLDSFNQIR